MSRKLKEKAVHRLSSEKGTVIKRWGRKVTVALVYPNTYYVGMSNLGYQQVYYLLNQREDTLCERVFLPDREDMDEYQRTGTQIFSLESQRPLRDFDIIAFSIPFENDYLNALKILEMGNIPLMAAERSEEHPLVIAGGVTTFLNPEPIADFIDLFLIGEGEEVVNQFIDSFIKNSNGDKQEMLSSLSKVEGAYVPSFYQVAYKENGEMESFLPKGKVPKKVKRRWIRDIDSAPTISRIFAHDTEFSGMQLVEISRGCGRGCRFCTAGFIYLPPRIRNPKKILNDISGQWSVASGKSTHIEKVGLVSAAVSDYPFINSLCAPLIAKGKKVSVSSLRMDSTTDELVDALKNSGHKTMTFAPEAGTERLRNVINKGISEDDILKSVEMAISRGILNAKLYFLIGLPAETDDDIEGIVKLAKRIKKEVLALTKEAGRIGTITLSINPFIPKPWTPFQWSPMEDVKSLGNKLGCIKGALKKEGNIEVNHENPKDSYLQALLSRGDRRVGRVIRKALETGSWSRGIKDSQVDTDFYVYRIRNKGEILHWDFIYHGIEKGYLWKEYERALKGKFTPPCNPPKCHRCGVC
ncbi:MAG: TIGR03960 family B12-binding radical SAM protein [Deltaproteobacteria bacterium]|nr:TIGR03960 family B12-binding radical SAM protein [Deltaproteobacteria bacterium]